MALIKTDDRCHQTYNRLSLSLSTNLLQCLSSHSERSCAYVLQQQGPTINMGGVIYASAKLECGFLSEYVTALLFLQVKQAKHTN